MHVMWWWQRLYYVLQAFPCATQPHVMTSVGVSGPAVAWEIASARIPPFISKLNKQIQWKQPLLVSCFNVVYNIMARRICINKFWLAGGKAIILIGFLFYTCIVGVNPQPWMPINTQTNESIASIRSAWVAPIPPNTLLKSWTQILQKSVQSWYIPFALQACYDIRASKIVHVQQLRVLENEVLARKFDVQDPFPCSPPEC